jgi:hypothetical protein
MTDTPAIVFGRQLLGQLFWIREHGTYDDMPDSLAELGEWRLDPEAITVRLNDFVGGMHYAAGALLRELDEAGIDSDEALRRAALRLAD